MSLLAHRGSMRRRSRPGFLQQFAAVVRTAVAGRSGRRDSGPLTRRAPAAGLGLAAAALVCVGVGYLLGNSFPWRGSSPGNEAADGVLRASVTQPRNGIAPGPIGEPEDMRPLAGRYFLTAAYEQLADASGAARLLRQAGLPSARLQQVPLGDKTFYGLVVYFDGDRERDATRGTLMTVAPPDAEFERYRKTQKGWPLEQEVR